MSNILCELIRVLLFSSITCDPTIRQTKNGPVEGVEQSTLFGKTYYAFKGVPYAEAPITGKDPYSGAEVDRRFKSPEPLTRKWTEPLKVHNYSDGCAPSSTFMPTPTTKSENCLFLNVYVPDGGSKKKTVLVFIHGGSFTEGSGDNLYYGPDFLIDPDNVLVTINYRLGIFGFLNLGFEPYTGNMGLKDQQMALKWIYENIENFGGNKEEILLFGESAGAASVNYQMLNEESRKYFQRALLLSSTALNYYTLYEPNHLERMQKHSNIQDKDELVEYLKTLDSDTLSQCETTSDFGTILLQSHWVPTIEDSKTKGAFLTKHPEEIYQSDEAPAMDTVLSMTSQEYITFNTNLTKNGEPFLSGDSKDSNLLLAFNGFDKETYPKEFQNAFELLKKAYCNHTTNVDDIKRKNTALLSDMNFGYGILKTFQYQMKANNEGNNKRNTFLQRFSVNANINLFKLAMQLSYDGAAHAEDICYMFRCCALDSMKIYENNLEIRNSSNVNYNAIMHMVNIITNFARNGDPSIEGDVPFELSTPPDKICSQDITNDSKTKAVTDIMEQLHFNTWQKIENIYKIIKT
ncbi:esterase B1-like [Contarinia nasturtii]|uniref:esterase B1-like n=1 Tax=Contarinia nasturtii TaxID=265458 RepID=UPI0012D3F5D2|nr:esterase B1-like [Contarinia nasturtii]XP_031627087.1 esterase B1-like [Contarinia nasturtii]